MKNQDQWRPSKYVKYNGRLIANRDRTEVGVGSRLIADMIAEFYSRELPIHAKGSLLDLGCGKVPLYIVYKDLADQITCVDWGNTLHKNQHLDFECDLTQPLPFNDGKFDTIILSDVLNHLPEAQLIWSEMARVLAPGGKLILNTPFYYWLNEMPYDYYRYTEFALRRFAERVGLTILSLDCVGGAPEIMTDIFAKQIIRVPVIGRPLASLAQWNVMFWRRRREEHKSSSRAGRNFPFYYTLIAKK